jgi:pantetheine-phosphate adenylyltransferase
VKAIFPGSFDPLTNGHLDLISRALLFVDELVIAIMINPDKPGLLPVSRRKQLIIASCAERNLSGYQVVVDEGLLVDLARQQGSRLVIRGVRNSMDWEIESAMARANALLLPGLETILLSASGMTGDISSSLVRQIASFGGDVRHFVPACVAQALIDSYTDAKRHF